ncbi:methionine ABC transporter ATP-binding protein [Rhodococcus sp. NM-2]|uniref:methionine ABC transporter ATP-binding protein n=1 Tax=Rhodococcus sp. NM-2 TaxID=3401174 RepID=UPI003AAE1AF4
MIEVRSVTKRFGKGSRSVEVLHDIDFSVGTGQIAAVIGQSGAGKTTLSRIISLLERPSEGRILLDGTDVSGLSERLLRDQRRAIGTIFQASSLLARRTAAENVALPLEFAGVGRSERRARVAELLERVGLSDKADLYPRQLSGGQRQRVGIARSLALAPKVLVSDEATSGLDPNTTRSILALLRELRDDLGLTIVLITHEMDVVRQVADVVTVLDAGRVVESGPVIELLRDPRSELGVGLLPDRSHITAADRDVLWHVTYGSDTVPTNWIELLGKATGRSIGVLSGTVESVGGRPAGRVTISVAGEHPSVGDLLSSWGLHGTRVDAAASARTTEEAAA